MLAVAVAESGGDNSKRRRNTKKLDSARPAPSALADSPPEGKPKRRKSIPRSENSKTSILRVRMSPASFRRLRNVAEYERRARGEKGEGKWMSILVLSWILDGMEASDARRRAAESGFTGRVLSEEEAVDAVEAVAAAHEETPDEMEAVVMAALTLVYVPDAAPSEALKAYFSAYDEWVGIQQRYRNDGDGVPFLIEEDHLSRIDQLWRALSSAERTYVQQQRLLGGSNG